LENNICVGSSVIVVAVSQQVAQVTVCKQEVVTPRVTLEMLIFLWVTIGGMYPEVIKW
jgi:hypothetical protein